jgi:hypothetical protein
VGVNNGSADYLLAIPSFEVTLVRLNDPLIRTRPLANGPLSTSRSLLVRPESRDVYEEVPWVPGSGLNRLSEF